MSIPAGDLGEQMKVSEFIEKFKDYPNHEIVVFDYVGNEEGKSFDSALIGKVWHTEGQAEYFTDKADDPMEVPDEKEVEVILITVCGKLW